MSLWNSVMNLHQLDLAKTSWKQPVGSMDRQSSALHIPRPTRQSLTAQLKLLSLELCVVSQQPCCLLALVHMAH